MSLNPDGTVALPEPVPDSHLSPLAIVNCGMCDDDGYRGALVCDHVDHAAETVRGRELAKAELERIRLRRAQKVPDQAATPEEG